MMPGAPRVNKGINQGARAAKVMSRDWSLASDLVKATQPTCAHSEDARENSLATQGYIGMWLHQWLIMISQTIDSSN